MMKNVFLMFCIMFFTVSEVFAYAVKVYDNCGNRIGTYRKHGDTFELYDFYDRKVENPEDLIKNAPSQKVLKEQVQFFYDANMNPIGSFSTGIWGNGLYIPRFNYHGFYPPPMHFHHIGHPTPPRHFRPANSPYIIRNSVLQIK